MGVNIPLGIGSFADMREWYDGYRFGQVDVYCPWDVLNHIAALMQNSKTEPKSYWGGSSSNNVVLEILDLKIPNNEVNDIFRETIDRKKRYAESLNGFSSYLTNSITTPQQRKFPEKLI